MKMKNIFRLVSLVVVVGALVGATYLVKNRQLLQRGATQAETSASILPTSVEASTGETVSVQLWVNTGKNEDKLTGAEIKVSYDSRMLMVSGFTPSESGYTLLNDLSDDVSRNRGIISINMVAMGAEVGGAVNLGKLTFVALIPEKGKIAVMPESKLMISGQSSTWKIASGQSSMVVVKGDTVTCVPRPACLDAKPPCMIPDRSDYCPKTTTAPVVSCGTTGKCPLGYTCKSPAPNCTKQPNGQEICIQKVGLSTCVKDVVKPTPKAVNSCGKRCTSDSMCGSNQICAPIWWPCQTLPTEVKNKLQNDVGLSQSDVSGITVTCPMIKNLTTSNDQGDGKIGTPLFYGVCRNKTCVSSPGCNCSSNSNDKSGSVNPSTGGEQR